MTKRLLNRLQSAWEDPAITLQMGDTRVNLGQGPVQATVTITKPRLMTNFLLNPSLTFGEGYMSGEIQVTGDLLSVLEGYYKATVRLQKGPTLSTLAAWRKRSAKIKPQTAIQNARRHYDVGNDFYKLWLDPTMAYTCAYFLRDTDSLEQAQRQKFELVCRKSRLQPGHSIIDIGCGWGGLIFHAVERYGVTATGVVAAVEQGQYIMAEAKRRGIADKVHVIIGDWRQAAGQYDRVFSVGITEHVGERHYGEFFQKYHDLLKEDGIGFLHTIGAQNPHHTADPWLTKYIFPGGHLPLLEQLATAARSSGFFIVDTEDIWQHYSLTLHHWATNFAAARAEVVEMFDEEFARMWELYLLGCEAGFRWGGLHLWQLVFTASKKAPWPLNREVNGGKKEHVD